MSWSLAAGHLQQGMASKLADMLIELDSASSGTRSTKQKNPGTKCGQIIDYEPNVARKETFH